MTQCRETHERLVREIYSNRTFMRKAGAFLFKTTGELLLQQEQDRNQI